MTVRWRSISRIGSRSSVGVAAGPAREDRAHARTRDRARQQILLEQGLDDAEVVQPKQRAAGQQQGGSPVDATDALDLLEAVRVAHAVDLDVEQVAQAGLGLVEEVPHHMQRAAAGPVIQLGVSELALMAEQQFLELLHQCPGLAAFAHRTQRGDAALDLNHMQQLAVVAGTPVGGAADGIDAIRDVLPLAVARGVVEPAL
jgi:ribonuclease D